MHVAHLVVVVCSLPTLDVRGLIPRTNFHGTYFVLQICLESVSATNFRVAQLLYSDWLKLVMQLAASNQSALIQCGVFALL